jgi:hypothetical protein
MKVKIIMSASFVNFVVSYFFRIDFGRLERFERLKQLERS